MRADPSLDTKSEQIEFPQNCELILREIVPWRSNVDKMIKTQLKHLSDNLQWTYLHTWNTTETYTHAMQSSNHISIYSRYNFHWLHDIYSAHANTCTHTYTHRYIDIYIMTPTHVQSFRIYSRAECNSFALETSNSSTPYMIIDKLGPHLLTWYTFNPSTDK